jgi:hypothetical protein
MPDDDPNSRPPSPTRRKFLLRSGSGVAASLVAGYVPALAKDAAAEVDSAPTSAAPNIEGAIPVTLRINGKDHSLRIDPRTTSNKFGKAPNGCNEVTSTSLECADLSALC